MFKFINLILIVFFYMCSIMACGDDKEHAEVSYNYKFYKPLYGGVELVASSDTLHFLLNKADNSVESICPFSVHGTEYVAFYNQPSETVNIYELYSQKLVKTISLTGYLFYRRHSTSVYCKNFDSIFINNNTTSLFITDSSGINRKTIFFPESSGSKIVDFTNTRPPVLKDSCLYASFPASGKMTTIGQVRELQLMCRLDLKNNKKRSFYHLSERYMNKFYGFNFLNYSYCFNNSGNFVFSFPADSNLYETNFYDVNRAFYGRSQFQQGDIEPKSKKTHGHDADMEFLTKDYYGSVFFDPYHKRYLRVFRHKISNKDLAANKYDRERSILIFNEDFQIIGESPLLKGFLINSLFYTSNGQMYARTKQKDKTTLHFIRLIYKEKAFDSLSLAQKNKS